MKRGEPRRAEPLAPELAALVERWQAEHGGESLPPILDPLPSVEAARAFRRREGPAERGGHYVMRDIEAARDHALPEKARAAAIGRVADWLARRWRVPAWLRGTLAQLARDRREALTDRRRDPLGRRRRGVTFKAIKLEVLASAAADVMAEDDEPIAVSLRRVVRRDAAGRERAFLPLPVIYGRLAADEAAAFMPLVEGLLAPGRFGWWSLYRDWFIERAFYHAERRLAEASRIPLRPSWREESLEETSPPSRWDAGYDRAEEAADAAREELRLARLIAALPNEATRRAVRALDRSVQSWVAKALPFLTGGKQKQAQVVLAWAKNDCDRGRAFREVGVSRSAGDKILNRAFDRLREVGLAAFKA